jgi:staphylococcal nuclease domain-containing protein 1
LACRVLHRDVRIVLDGVDKYNNLFGSVFYSEDNVAQDLALQLVSQVWKIQNRK